MSETSFTPAVVAKIHELLASSPTKDVRVEHLLPQDVWAVRFLANVSSNTGDGYIISRDGKALQV